MIIETSVNLKNKNKDELIALLNESLKVIQAQQAEIEHQKEKRENQKKELSILNEKQKEFNKLRNTVNSYKGQFKRQQAEIEKKDRTIQQLKDENKTLNRQAQQYFETTIIQSQQYDKETTKKDKIIDEMANSFAEEGFYSEHCQTLIDNDICPDDCNKCVKQYFERKVETEDK